MGKTDQLRDIGSHKELFIDETPIAAMQNVRLTMNAPYQDHEPVFLPEAPWEHRIHPYATVMREGSAPLSSRGAFNNVFRLWYLAYEWDPPAGVELPVTGTGRGRGPLLAAYARPPLLRRVHRRRPLGAPAPRPGRLPRQRRQQHPGAGCA